MRAHAPVGDHDLLPGVGAQCLLRLGKHLADPGAVALGHRRVDVGEGGEVEVAGVLLRLAPRGFQLRLDSLCVYDDRTCVWGGGWWLD